MGRRLPFVCVSPTPASASCACVLLRTVGFALLSSGPSLDARGDEARDVR